MQKQLREIKDSDLTVCQEKLALYELMVENSNSIIIRWNDKGILFMNRYGLDYFGYRKEEIVGRPLQILIPSTESTGKNLEHLTDDIIKNPNHYAWHENENIKKDRQRTWIAWSNKGVLDANGHLRETVSVGNDITFLKQTQNALESEKERFRKLIVDAQNGMFHANIDGTLYYFNDAFRQFFEYDSNENLKKHNAFEFMASLKDQRTLLDVLISDKKLRSYPVTIKTPKGDIKKILVTATLYQDQVFGSINDVTELYEKECFLKKKEEELKTLFNNLPDMVARWSSNLRILFINKKIKEMTGFEPEKYLGKNIEQLDLKYKKQIEKSINEAIKTLEVQHPEEFEIETAKGRRYFDVLFIPERINHSIESVISIARDITEQKEIEKALATSHESLKLAHRAGKIGTFDWDMITNKTSCTLHKKSMACVVDEYEKGWEKEIHPEDLPRVKKLLNNCLQEKCSELEVEYRLNNYDGATRWISNRGKIIYDLDGTPLRMIGTSIDITIWKEAETVLKRDKAELEKLVEEHSEKLFKTELELEHSKRLSQLGSLAATVAHELRNPLAAINAAAYNIRKKIPTPEILKHLENIRKKVDEGNEIINDLLSFSRIRKPEIQKISLNNLLEESVQLAQNYFRKYPVQLEKEYSKIDGIQIEGDRRQLEEVFVNLIQNAYDALSNKEGKKIIRISGNIRKQIVEVGVTDNGCGMAPLVVEKAKEPFFSTKPRGTGLGLSLSQEIIQMHRGKILINSEEEKGTKVIICLRLTPFYSPSRVN